MGWSCPAFAPGDPGYAEEFATLNHTVEHRPALVVGARTSSDVAQAVAYAARQSLSVCVQSTGHGMCARADGVLITTRRMDTVEVDPAARTARLGAGTRWRDVLPATAAHGLAPLNGSSPEVGTVGYILGGGVGMLGRQYGYAADHVSALEVVTADGAVRRVGPREEPRLFAGILGSKGNLGVVTEIEIGLFPVTSFYGGGLYFPADSARDLLRTYSSWTRDLPETLATSVFLSTYPDADGVPPALRGRYVAHLRAAYFGPAVEAERLLAPVRTIGPVLLDTLRDRDYTDIGAVHHEPVAPYSVCESGFFTGPLAESDLRSVLALAGPEAADPVMLEIRHHSGAYRHRPDPPNTVGGRGAEFTVFLGCPVDPEDPSVSAHRHAAARRLFHAVDQGTVVNFLGAWHGPESVRTAYSDQDHHRLRELKTEFDPRNLFRVNHNITPRRGRP
ncbi:FAD/FMN-containing dehydrogenase [Nocardiopsis sp. Huas11]|uniref:FAD-binding oxidoreductase n=1 Tax=Nocardiopsis sp. Huas11 TaxID=2183912 RepID=UPI000EAD7CEC|nr:FAD-binding oxidoreductase [Nocardiopsis sp. Huas11]RKS08117.1 FAD/FMN-containing dehydrogenase [Nocardiopsis sp. Huas11]